MKAILAVIACVAVVVSAVSYSEEPQVVLFDRDVVPNGWLMGAQANAASAFTYIISLNQRNLPALERLFWAVSDPKSPEYQNYMSKDEILDLVAPEASAAAAVIAWLESSGVASSAIVNHRDAIEVTATTVGEVAALFNCQLYSFTNTATKQTVERVFGTVTLPASIAALVYMIDGLSSFPIPHLKAQTPRAALPGAGTFAVVPQTLAAMYQIPAQTEGAAPQTSVGVIEFQGQYYAPKDLESFSTQVGIPSEKIPANRTVGTNEASSPQIESTLDIEMVSTVDNAADNWFWIEPGQGWLYGFVIHFFGTTEVPQVVSISYGWCEADQCQIDPTVCKQEKLTDATYVLRVNAEFQKIALRGISVLVASGDSGANGRTDPTCTTPYLKPDYPAACPYITSVGATQVDAPTALNGGGPVCTGGDYTCIGGGNEVAVSYKVAQFASGGGFSNFAGTPSYQSAAVQNYLSTNTQLPPASYYNATGRGYPDIAALGNAVLIYQGGIQPVGGTSCAAPEFAAVIALLNQYAIRKSGQPLGFLNPFLYQMQAADATTFHDITAGNNICTESGCASGCKGFYAQAGWDPVTGLGSPNAANMISYVQDQWAPARKA